MISTITTIDQDTGLIINNSEYEDENYINNNNGYFVSAIDVKSNNIEPMDKIKWVDSYFRDLFSEPDYTAKKPNIKMPKNLLWVVKPYKYYFNDTRGYYIRIQPMRFAVINNNAVLLNSSEYKDIFLQADEGRVKLGNSIYTGIIFGYWFEILDENGANISNIIKEIDKSRFVSDFEYIIGIIETYVSGMDTFTTNVIQSLCSPAINMFYFARESHEFIYLNNMVEYLIETNYKNQQNKVTDLFLKYLQHVREYYHTITDPVSKGIDSSVKMQSNITEYMRTYAVTADLEANNINNGIPKIDFSGSYSMLDEQHVSMTCVWRYIISKIDSKFIFNEELLLNYIYGYVPLFAYNPNNNLKDPFFILKNKLLEIINRAANFDGDEIYSYTTNRLKFAYAKESLMPVKYTNSMSFEREFRERVEFRPEETSTTKMCNNAQTNIMLKSQASEGVFDISINFIIVYILSNANKLSEVDTINFIKRLLNKNNLFTA